MTAWAHLPNAMHIDRMMRNLGQTPLVWDAAWDIARDEARDVVWNAVDTARDAAWDAARDAAWDAARDASRGVARDAAWGAIAALIAYDDCAYLFNQTPDFVRGHINLTNEPAAILLLPAVTAMQGEHHGLPI